MDNKGFTLIELMVSVTIFIVVMTISLGALLSISAANRKAEALKTVMNNLSFSLESMSRAIRTGVDYGCNSSGDCTSGTGGYRFSFTDVSQRDVTYCLGSGTSCETSTACPAGTSCTILRSINGGTLEPLTSQEVAISNLSFYLQGSATGDGVQPKVVITLNGSITIGASPPTQFALQTSVTQRLYDQ